MRPRPIEAKAERCTGMGALTTVVIMLYILVVQLKNANRTEQHIKLS